MHGAEEEKGHFPYQWLTSWQKLDQDHLPPVEEFATGLVEGENVLGKNRAGDPRELHPPSTCVAGEPHD